MSKSLKCFLPAPPIRRSQNPGQRRPLSGVDHRQTNKQTRFSCNYGRGKDVHPSPKWSLATITSLLTYSPSLASIGDTFVEMFILPDSVQHLGRYVCTMISATPTKKRYLLWVTRSH